MTQQHHNHGRGGHHAKGPHKKVGKYRGRGPNQNNGFRSPPRHHSPDQRDYRDRERMSPERSNHYHSPSQNRGSYNPHYDNNDYHGQPRNENYGPSDGYQGRYDLYNPPRELQNHEDWNRPSDRQSQSGSRMHVSRTCSPSDSRYRQSSPRGLQNYQDFDSPPMKRSGCPGPRHQGSHSPPPRGLQNHRPSSREGPRHPRSRSSSQTENFNPPFLQFRDCPPPPEPYHPRSGTPNSWDDHLRNSSPGRQRFNEDYHSEDHDFRRHDSSENHRQIQIQGPNSPRGLQNRKRQNRPPMESQDVRKDSKYFVQPEVPRSQGDHDEYQNGHQSSPRGLQNQQNFNGPSRSSQGSRNCSSAGSQRSQGRNNDHGYQNLLHRTRSQESQDHSPRGLQNYQRRSRTPDRRSQYDSQDYHSRAGSPSGSRPGSGYRGSSPRGLQNYSAPPSPPRGLQSQPNCPRYDGPNGPPPMRRSYSPPRGLQTNYEPRNCYSREEPRNGRLYSPPRGLQNQQDWNDRQSQSGSQTNDHGHFDGYQNCSGPSSCGYDSYNPPRGLQNCQDRSRSPDRQSQSGPRIHDSRACSPSVLRYRQSSPRGLQNHQDFDSPRRSRRSSSGSRHQESHSPPRGLQNRRASSSPEAARRQGSRSSSREVQNFEPPYLHFRDCPPDDDSRGPSPGPDENLEFREFRRRDSSENQGPRSPQEGQERRISDSRLENQENRTPELVKKHFPNPTKSWISWLEEQDAEKDSEDVLLEILGETRRALEEETPRPLVFRVRRATGAPILERMREKTMDEWRSEMEMKSSIEWPSTACRTPTNPPSFHTHRRNEPQCTKFSLLTRTLVDKNYSNPQLRHNCIYCEGRHKPDVCPVIVDVKDRRQHLENMGNCVRCLGKHRPNEKCNGPMDFPCGYCEDLNSTGDRHHRSLCPDVHIPRKEFELEGKDVKKWPDL